jgi:hypothetical protein
MQWWKRSCETCFHSRCNVLVIKRNIKKYELDRKKSVLDILNILYINCKNSSTFLPSDMYIISPWDIGVQFFCCLWYSQSVIIYHNFSHFSCIWSHSWSCWMSDLLSSGVTSSVWYLNCSDKTEHVFFSLFYFHKLSITFCKFQWNFSPISLGKLLLIFFSGNLSSMFWQINKTLWQWNT